MGHPVHVLAFFVEYNVVRFVGERLSAPGRSYGSSATSKLQLSGKIAHQISTPDARSASASSGMMRGGSVGSGGRLSLLQSGVALGRTSKPVATNSTRLPDRVHQRCSEFRLDWRQLRELGEISTGHRTSNDLTMSAKCFPHHKDRQYDAG